MCKMGEEECETQVSSYRMNKAWGQQVQYGETINVLIECMVTERSHSCGEHGTMYSHRILMMYT